MNNRVSLTHARGIFQDVDISDKSQELDLVYGGVRR